MTFQQAAKILADEVQKSLSISAYHASHRKRANQIANAMSIVTGKQYSVKPDASSFTVYTVIAK